MFVWRGDGEPRHPTHRPPLRCSRAGVTLPRTVRACRSLCGILGCSMQRLLPILPVLFCACIPMPHTDRFSPDVTAKLTDNGVPVAGAQVQFTVNSPGMRSGPHVDVGTTSASGEVTFSAPSVERLVMTMGDREDSWEVVFSTPNALTVHRNGWWGGAVTETIECDLLSPLSSDQIVDLPSGIPNGTAGAASCSVTSP